MKSTLFLTKIEMRAVQHGNDGIATHVSDTKTWTEDSEESITEFVAALREEGETVEVLEAWGDLVDENGDISEKNCVFVSQTQTFHPASVEHFVERMNEKYELDKSTNPIAA